MVTSVGRHLLGREVCALMGMPIHELRLGCCSENVSCSEDVRVCVGLQVLHSLGGNCMAMRAIMPCICVALAACKPEKLMIS